jgi:hypothetical protein
MTPFAHLKQWQVRQRYRAALTIYVASYTYKTLSIHDQCRISDWVKDLIDGQFNPSFSFKEYELFLPIHTKAAFWAVAMNALGIPPAVPGETWLIPRQRGWLRRFGVINKLIRDWRPFNATTTQVQEFLNSKGIDTSTIDLQAR